MSSLGSVCCVAEGACVSPDETTEGRARIWVLPIIFRSFSLSVEKLCENRGRMLAEK
jgi:hypothetical protein